MTTSSVSPVTTELAGSETGITLVIHAGAGSRGKHSTPERIAQVELDLQRALDAGYQLLESGAPRPFMYAASAADQGGSCLLYTSVAADE